MPHIRNKIQSVTLTVEEHNLLLKIASEVEICSANAAARQDQPYASYHVWEAAKAYRLWKVSKEIKKERRKLEELPAPRMVKLDPRFSGAKVRAPVRARRGR